VERLYIHQIEDRDNLIQE